MRKNIFFFIVLVSLFSCGNELKNYKLIEIDIIETSIVLPSKYKIISPTNYLIKLLDSKKATVLVSHIEQSIMNSLNSDINFELLYDTTNVNNSIIIFKENLPILNQYMASKYLKELEEMFDDNWSPQGVEYVKVGSSFVRKKPLEFIKLKYLKEYNEDIMYFTQFFINRKDKSYILTINGDGKDDFEKGLRLSDKQFYSKNIYNEVKNYLLEQFK